MESTDSSISANVESELPTDRKRDADEMEGDQSDQSLAVRYYASDNTNKEAFGIRQKRHRYQDRYTIDFALLPLERDPISNEVTLATCGLCKAFGREKDVEGEKVERTEAQDGKKRRRKSNTTIKFFRTFRVDNLRSHMHHAHPKRWEEFNALPKTTESRMQFLNSNTSVVKKDSSHFTDPMIMLSTGSVLPPTSDTLGNVSTMDVTNSLLHSSTSTSIHPTDTSHASSGDVSTMQSETSQSLHANPNQSSSTLTYEAYLREHLALERQKLEFAKKKFQKKVELKERELTIREQALARKERTWYESVDWEALNRALAHFAPAPDNQTKMSI